MTPLEQRLLQSPAIAELIANFNQMNREREKTEAKADPVKHKLSMIFERSAAYRYWRAGRDGRGREVRFCWSSHRNVAGYFLTWCEIVGKSGGKRSRFSASRSRTACRAMAERRREAWVLARADGIVAAATQEEA